MEILTIRKSLNKIKLFKNVRQDVNVYTSLLANRGIDWSDLFVYKPLISINSLPHEYNFDFGENSTIENATEIHFYNIAHTFVNVPTLTEWQFIDAILRQEIYSAAELDDIAFNETQETVDTWRAVPSKEIPLLVEQEEKVYINTIPVERLTE